MDPRFAKVKPTSSGGESERTRSSRAPDHPAGGRGPAFEAIARAWTARHASADTLGGIPA
jgi:hypothetical protein